MRVAILGVLGIVAISGMALGGLEYRKQQVCTGLENDYLNAVGRMRDAAASQAAVARIMKPPASFDQIIRKESGKMTAALISIGEHCGKRAADTASRKGGEMVR